MQFTYNKISSVYQETGSYNKNYNDNTKEKTHENLENIYGKGGNKITSNVFISKFVYDLLDENHNQVTPFVFAGVGVAKNKLTDLKVQYLSESCGECSNTFQGTNKTTFAWQLGAGFKVNITDKTAITFSGKYFDNGNIRSKNRVYDGYEDYGDGKNFDPASPTKIKQNFDENLKIKIRGFGGTIGLIWKF